MGSQKIVFKKKKNLYAFFPTVLYLFVPFFYRNVAIVYQKSSRVYESLLKQFYYFLNGKKCIGKQNCTCFSYT